MKKVALGKGINALIPQAMQYENRVKKEVLELEIEKIRENPLQPRGSFNQEKLTELANSIKEKGILQPVIVRKVQEGYEIVAGERRLIAAKKLGLSLIPAILAENLSNEGSLELSIIENIQREDLNPIDEAKGYKRLLEEFGLSQEDISRKVGKDRSTISNVLRLLNLPEEIKEKIISGELTEGHARALLSLTSEDQRILLSKEIIDKGLSVRETEDKVYGRKRVHGRRLKRIYPQLQLIEDRLKEYFGTSVKLVKGKKRGKILIEFYSEEDLNRILDLLRISL
ncbi:MAG: ParB/RepB/Spo0J family partition protein [candidate division Zixibacteria bacterium]|nr:ParB/RepB/Spo0J family partition protein [candidate division Zixibacteria bacterium]